DGSCDGGESVGDGADEGPERAWNERFFDGAAVQFGPSDSARGLIVGPVDVDAVDDDPERFRSEGDEGGIDAGAVDVRAADRRFAQLSVRPVDVFRIDIEGPCDPDALDEFLFDRVTIAVRATDGPFSEVVRPVDVVLVDGNVVGNEYSFFRRFSFFWFRRRDEVVFDVGAIDVRASDRFGGGVRPVEMFRIQSDSHHLIAR